MTRRQSRGVPAKAASQRQLRVGEELRHALARVLERGSIRDPEIAGRPVTVTEVRVSPDLRAATAFVTPLGGGDSGPLVAALKRLRPFLRHELAQEVRLRLVPDLFFEPDTSFDQAQRIEDLLRAPEVRRDIDDADGAVGPEGQDDGA